MRNIIRCIKVNEYHRNKILTICLICTLALMLSVLSAGCDNNSTGRSDSLTAEVAHGTDESSYVNQDAVKSNNDTQDAAEDIADNSNDKDNNASEGDEDPVTESEAYSTDVDKSEIRLINNQEGLPGFENSYLTEEMFLSAVPVLGDTSRLLSAMRKARNGEELTIGVIGGSITQGSLATASDKSYAFLLYKWWVEAFPDVKINFVNAGIGATNSYLGVHRVDKELLAKEPDVIVVEFSVNDSDTLFYKQSYESLIRKILGADNAPAVILLFMTMEDGTSAQPSHMHVGFWYDLPRISYRDAVLNEIEKAAFTWKDISPDNIHPNDRGHQITGEILWGYLNMILVELNNEARDDEINKVNPLDKKPLLEDPYSLAGIYDSTAIEPVQYGSFEKKEIQYTFKNSWTVSEGDEPIIFESEARNIGIMFYRTVDGRGGQFEVYVDGKHVRTLDADFKGGWGNYAESVEVYSSKERQSHTIQIRKADSSTGDVFNLLGLLIS